MKLDVSHDSLLLMVKVSEVVAMENVVVWTRWFVHTTQRPVTGKTPKVLLVSFRTEGAQRA